MKQTLQAELDNSLLSLASPRSEPSVSAAPPPRGTPDLGALRGLGREGTPAGDGN